jgi:hypothetical protein
MATAAKPDNKVKSSTTAKTDNKVKSSSVDSEKKESKKRKEGVQEK